MATAQEQIDALRDKNGVPNSVNPDFLADVLQPIHDEASPTMKVAVQQLGLFGTTASQDPTGLGAANSIQVSFGAGGTTVGGDFTMDALGGATFNNGDFQYQITLTIRLLRVGSTSQSHMVARIMYAEDGVSYSQLGPSFGVEIDNPKTVWTEMY